jgi:hypothetical protein
MPSFIPPTTSWYISIEINQTKWLQFKQDCGVSTAVRVYVYLGAFLNYFNHSLSGGLTAPPFSYVLVCGTIVLNSTQLNSFLLPFICLIYYPNRSRNMEKIVNMLPDKTSTNQLSQNNIRENVSS